MTESTSSDAVVSDPHSEEAVLELAEILYETADSELHENYRVPWSTISAKRVQMWAHGSYYFYIRLAEAAIKHYEER